MGDEPAQVTNPTSNQNTNQQNTNDILDFGGNKNQPAQNTTKPAPVVSNDIGFDIFGDSQPKAGPPQPPKPLGIAKHDISQDQYEEMWEEYGDEIEFSKRTQNVRSQREFQA